MSNHNEETQLAIFRLGLRLLCVWSPPKIAGVFLLFLFTTLLLYVTGDSDLSYPLLWCAVSAALMTLFLMLAGLAWAFAQIGMARLVSRVEQAEQFTRLFYSEARGPIFSLFLQVQKWF
ncbi:MAG: hypothetical protein ACXW3L_10035 [Limisphaerales bacterium]